MAHSTRPRSRPSRPGPKAADAKNVVSGQGGETAGAPGFRWTRQRREVYELLTQVRDHPTASELFIRAKEHIPGISLATVYNCLETLNQAGLVKQVNMDRGPSRYCANLREHAHLLDERTGAIIDVPLKRGVNFADLFDLPKGAVIEHAEISLRGTFAKSRKH